MFISTIATASTAILSEKGLNQQQVAFLRLIKTTGQAVYDAGHAILSCANEPISIDPSGKNFLPLAAASWKSLNDSDALELIESKHRGLNSYSLIAGLAAIGVSVLITNHSHFMTQNGGVSAAQEHIATQLKAYDEPQTGFGKVIFLSPEIITSQKIPW